MADWAIPAFIAAATGIDSLERWVRSFDVNLEEGDCSPSGWIVWGAIISRIYPNGEYRYFKLRLPSLKWDRHWDGDNYCWHWRVLWWSRGAGWRIQLEPYDG